MGGKNCFITFVQHNIDIQRNHITRESSCRFKTPLFYNFSSDATYQRLMSTVAQCEFTMEKSLLVYEMNLREQANYGKLNRQIGGKTYGRS